MKSFLYNVWNFPHILLTSIFKETTSNTLNFLILFMMLDQDAQDRLHTELDG
jgi:Cytochrome P450.